jgi:hypothetical protein
MNIPNRQMRRANPDEITVDGNAFLSVLQRIGSALYARSLHSAVGRGNRDEPDFLKRTEELWLEAMIELVVAMQGATDRSFVPHFVGDVNIKYSKKNHRVWINIDYTPNDGGMEFYRIVGGGRE